MALSGILFLMRTKWDMGEGLQNFFQNFVVIRRIENAIYCSILNILFHWKGTQYKNKYLSHGACMCKRLPQFLVEWFDKA